MRIGGEQAREKNVKKREQAGRWIILQDTKLIHVGGAPPSVAAEWDDADDVGLGSLLGAR